MAITLICIGIPVCRPLYKRAFRRLFGETSSSANGYRKQSAGPDGHSGSNSVPLRTIGGGLIGADGKPIVEQKAGSKKNTAVDKTVVDDGGSGSGDDGEISFTDVKLGVNGPFTRTTVGRGRSGSSSGGGGDNASDEEILDEYRRSQGRSARSRADDNGHHGGHGHNGIMVTESYRVERS
jgi:hypothetical protein